MRRVDVKPEAAQVSFHELQPCTSRGRGCADRAFSYSGRKLEFSPATVFVVLSLVFGVIRRLRDCRHCADRTR